MPEVLLAPFGQALAPWTFAVLSIGGGLALGIGVFRANALLLRATAALGRTRAGGLSLAAAAAGRPHT